jgi:hypothetical protein
MNEKKLYFPLSVQKALSMEEITKTDASLSLRSKTFESYKF